MTMNPEPTNRSQWRKSRLNTNASTLPEPRGVIMAGNPATGRAHNSQAPMKHCNSTESNTRNTPRGPAKAWLAPSMMLAVALAGCNLLPVSQGTSYAGSASAQSTDETSQLMFEIMIAEMAGRRGYMDIATEGYLSASRRTTDPRVAERATQLAVVGREWDKAGVAGQRWSELDPDNPEVYQALTQIYLRQSSLDRAASELGKYLALQSDVTVLDGTARSQSAGDRVFELLLREPDRQSALETLRILVRNHPENADAYLAQAQMAWASRDDSLAKSAVESALLLNPDHPSALLLKARIDVSAGDGTAAMAELRAAIERDPDNVDLQVGLARMLTAEGQYDQASELFDTVYNAPNVTPDALLTISLLALEARRTEAAKTYLTTLLENGDYLPQAHYYLGRIADSQGEFETAISHYESVTSGENALDAQIRAAELYGAIDRVDTGLARLRRLGADMRSDSIKPRLVRAEGRLLSQAGRWSEAFDVLSDGVDAWPDDDDLRYSRALVADHNGQSDVFTDDLLTLIAKDPENAHALNALGYHYADQNTNLQEAEAMLVKANALLPDDPAILDSLGWLRFRLNDYESALKLLREAYEMFPDPEIASHLGEVLWVSGDREAASAIWLEALEQNPDDDILLDVMKRFEQ